ncbi:MAG: bacteriocin-protection protein, partial [Burkholderiaceae bacterium]|nr:bacteriocin-protection protein [Burkholderiaceae bacterium]MBT9504880.1 bacteriocin-protection protein [Burkholderiaceae bacterium]
MPTFFATPAEFGIWLREHAAIETELIVGFHKRDSGRPSMTWAESVDEALCVGW